MTSQRTLAALLGSARLQTYLTAADNDVDHAMELYLWATELAGALHAQVSFVEIAVRNAMDSRLTAWNSAQGFPSDWTAERAAAPLLYGLLGRSLAEARQRAKREADDRPSGHPRHSIGALHDDVLAQLMFGSWVKIVRPFSANDSGSAQQQLWREAISGAFPRSTPGDAGRVAIGAQLETLRRLRNRVAHHDSLLSVNVRHRLNDILSLVSKIDRTFPPLVAARTPLRRLAREDPRLHW